LRTSIEPLNDRTNSPEKRLLVARTLTSPVTIRRAPSAASTRPPVSVNSASRPWTCRVGDRSDGSVAISRLDNQPRHRHRNFDIIRRRHYGDVEVLGEANSKNGAGRSAP
jgi:hypothetical protein